MCINDRYTEIKETGNRKKAFRDWKSQKTEVNFGFMALEKILKS